MEAEIVRSGFERKYLVPKHEAEMLLGAVAKLLPPDPHGASYPVASLYLDTPDLASYRREVQGKWRLRRYGEGEIVFAEFKAKPMPGSVHKRRSATTLGECLEMPYGEKAGWFTRAIHKNALRPTLLVSYMRHAFVGVLDGQEVRLTLDQELRASACREYCIPGPVSEGATLTEGYVLEIKFVKTLPPKLEEELATRRLLPASFSKYRTGIDRIFHDLDIVRDSELLGLTK
jgi:hypothetical protein